MDRPNYESSATASLQVQHDLLQEQQARQTGQSAFEQQLHEARQADTARPDRPLPPSVSSDSQQSPDPSMGALARSKLPPSEKGLINRHGTAELRQTNRPRSPINSQGVAFEQQPSEVASSLEAGGAMPAEAAPRAPQVTQVSIAGKKRKQPLYSKDAVVIVEFSQALTQGKLAESFVQRIVGPLLSFGRWLCANNKTGVIARLDNNSLTTDGDLFQYSGNNNDLILALDHLRTWRSTGHVPHPAPVRKRQKASAVYPHVSERDQGLIREVAQGVIASRKLKGEVANGYARNLTRLANDLGERGLSLDSSSDADLLAHVKKLFKSNKFMRAAVGALRDHRAPRAPGASSVGGRPSLPPADGDEVLIKGAISHALESDRLSSTTARLYDWALRKFSRELDLYGDTLSALSNAALRICADRMFRDEKWKMALDGGLKALGEYRQTKGAEPSGEGASGQAALGRAPVRGAEFAVMDVDPEELWQLLDVEGDEWPVMADDSALLRPDQQLPEETRELRDDQSGPLSALGSNVRDNNALDHLAAFLADPSRHRDPLGAPQELMSAPQSDVLQSEGVLIDDEHGTAELRPAKRPRNLDRAQAVAIQEMLIENGNSGEGVLMQAPLGRVVAWQWDAAAQHSGPQGGLSSPVVFPAEYYDQDLLWRAMDETAPSPSRGSIMSPPQARDSGESDHPLNWQPNRKAAITGSNLSPTRDMGPIEGTVHLNSFELPGGLVPTSYLRSLFAGSALDHHDDSRQPSLPHGLSPPVPAFSDDEAMVWLREEFSRRQMQESASPSICRAPSDLYGGLEPLVDLTTFTLSELGDDANSVPAFPSTSADDQIVALNAAALPRELVLGDEQWLGDEHILRDYQLQEQELHRAPQDFPALDIATRTRLVSPTLVHNLLRSSDDTVVERAFQRIVYDDKGNDTADFLFLPVSDADPSDPYSQGNHWSLLFLDRRDRSSPIAYHYDSRRGFNETSATHLAGRLGLLDNVVQAGIAQQQNGYDCGVFVVDGTRALVSGLVAGQRGVQNLNNLSVSRLALQARLRAVIGA
ncbi:Ulp1 family isopeptidase [Bradyrhizobium elkanii]|uniref:Ulp1 family isopeptidase n=1 Tax=Bradyrhizobium elkanii TaxID=29448 RepID=UPI001FD98353|nr:Ulp1 family isopeptidase [Bradyrhizobium elkanii]